MRRRIVNLAQATCWIALFAAAGFTLVKLGFGLVCWIGGHDWTEALYGYVASVVFGVAIGLESFLWLREWRHEKVLRD